MPSLWFDGICDLLYAKIKRWHDHYETGEVRATRKFLDMDGNLKDQPTRFLHTIPLSQKEAEYLVTIMQELRPKLPLTEQLAPLPRVLRSYPMNLRREYAVPFAYYKPDVREILKALDEARAAAKNITAPTAVEDFIAQQRKKGGHLLDLSSSP